MRRLLVVYLWLTVLLLSGCGGVHGDNGTLTMELVDAPGDVDSLEVVIKRIDVEIGAEWVTVVYPNQAYELLDLQIDPVVLANAGVAEGSYTKIRVAIASARVNHSVDVFVPESIQNEGLEILVDFDMESSHRTTLLLDFNVAQSLKLGPGGYFLDPVIPTVVKEESGTVSGFVTLMDVGIGGTELEAEYVAGPNYPVGTIVNSARSQADGMFRLWALLPGEYKINAVHHNAITGVVSKAVVNGIVVDAGLDTFVGDVSLN